MTTKIAKIEQFLQTLEDGVLSDPSQSIILSTEEGMMDGTGGVNTGCSNSSASSCGGTNDDCSNYEKSCGDSTNKTKCLNTDKSQFDYQNYLKGCPGINTSMCEVRPGNATCNG